MKRSAPGAGTGGGDGTARPSVRRPALAGVLLMALTACAPGPTVVVEPGAGSRLAAVETLQVGLAEVSTLGVGTDTVVDIGPSLSRRLDRSLSRITVLPQPGGLQLSNDGPGPAAEGPTTAILLYRQADRLERYRRPQSNERWYWWATVVDRDERTLATLHGERKKTAGDPEAQLARELKRLFKAARTTNR